MARTIFRITFVFSAGAKELREHDEVSILPNRVGQPELLGEESEQSHRRVVQRDLVGLLHTLTVHHELEETRADALALVRVVDVEVEQTDKAPLVRL